MNCIPNRLLTQAKDLLKEEKQKIIKKNHSNFPMGALLSQLQIENLDLIESLLELGVAVASSSAIEINELSEKDKIEISEKMVQYKAKEIAAMEISDNIKEQVRRYNENDRN